MEGLLNATSDFFRNDTMYEFWCEPSDQCNVDQRSFKGYLGRFMALTVTMAPFTASYIMPKLRTSAIAAAAHCSFGADQNTCGMTWLKPDWDNREGLGEQMCALEVIQNSLIQQVAAPVTENTGGTSKGNPAAGAGGDKTPTPSYPQGDRKKDKIGAGFATAAILILVISGGYFMVV